MTLDEQRAAVITEVVSWIAAKTPFHHAAQIKGVGVDCARFIIACYNVIGMGKGIVVPESSTDWFNHHEDDRFLSRIQQFMHEVPEPQTGDCVMFKMGQSWAHAGIVMPNWPVIAHARWYQSVQYCDCTQGDMGRQERRYFSPWQISTSNVTSNPLTVTGDCALA